MPLRAVTKSKLTYNHSSSQQVQDPGAAQEGERGILGALGGAIIGSITEDYIKKGRKPSCSPSRLPHPECGCPTPCRCPTPCHCPKVPTSCTPKPPCHCPTPTHEPHCHHYEAP